MLKKGINVDEIFTCKRQLIGNIFVGLKQTETSSADEQLARDTEIELNKKHQNKIFSTEIILFADA